MFLLRAFWVRGSTWVPHTPWEATSMMTQSPIQVKIEGKIRMNYIFIKLDVFNLKNYSLFWESTLPICLLLSILFQCEINGWNFFTNVHIEQLEIQNWNLSHINDLRLRSALAWTPHYSHAWQFCQPISFLMIEASLSWTVPMTWRFRGGRSNSNIV